MHTTIAVSIIIPTFNRAYILPSAVRSVLDQTISNWELVIVDDGSSDSTKEVVASFNDDRIVYVAQKNAGQASARNHGVSIAQGKWIAYLDSDNELLPTYLERMLFHVEGKKEVVFAIPRGHRTQELYKNGVLVRSIDDSDNMPKLVTLQDIFMRNFHFDTNGFMHLRKVFSDTVCWDSTIPMLEDWEFAMTLGEHYLDGFLYIDETLYNYHQRFGGDGVVSNTTYSDWAKVFEKIYQKHKNDVLLQGQTWYPSRVEKWNQKQKDFEEGKLPPYYLSHFPEEWQLHT